MADDQDKQARNTALMLANQRMPEGATNDELLAEAQKLLDFLTNNNGTVAAIEADTAKRKAG